MKQSERSAVVEIFEEGGFARTCHKRCRRPIRGAEPVAGEFELLASSLNHRYFAVHKDRVLERDDWAAIGGKRGPGEKVGDVHCLEADNQAPFPASADTIVGVVEDMLLQRGLALTRSQR